jgi:hypothetical protein
MLSEEDIRCEFPQGAGRGDRSQGTPALARDRQQHQGVRPAYRDGKDTKDLFDVDRMLVAPDQGRLSN